MSTQQSLASRIELPDVPGIALVQGIYAPARFKSPNWERTLLRLCLYLLPTVWALLQAALRLIGGHRFSSSSDAPFTLVFSFAWIAAIECFSATSCKRISKEHTGGTAVMISVCISLVAAWLLLSALGVRPPALWIFMMDAAFLLIAALVVKCFFRGAFRSQIPLARIVLVDKHDHCGKASWIFIRKGVARHETSGAIRLTDIEGSQQVKIVHSIDELSQEIHRELADGVFISVSPEDIAELTARIEAGNNQESSVRLILDTGDFTVPRRGFSKSDCLYLLNAASAPERTVHYLFLKRIFDVVFSAAALLAGLPLMIVIGVAVKASSRGRIFFAQDRVGWNGRLFRMYKFRTMYEAPITVSDTRWSRPDDARRTVVGKILRKYSLDELPQFFNVLRGEMSVVGPRPERPYFVDSFRRGLEQYHRRHQIKVGITGWAQVNGLRGDTCIRTRLLYDLYYLQNWGLIFDLKIILRTVFCVFCGRNAS